MFKKVHITKCLCEAVRGLQASKLEISEPEQTVDRHLLQLRLLLFPLLSDCLEDLHPLRE